MSYLKSKHGLWILVGFLLSVLLFAAFPQLDLIVSGYFFDNGFHIQDQWWQVALRDGVQYFLIGSLALVTGVYLFNRFHRRAVGGVCGKKVCYLFLVLILGAGLIVNLGFKDNFGRARPRNVAEFGGTKQFTPPFVVSAECRKNCSFSSGEGAAGFFSLALALALTRKRRWFAAAIAFGVVVSLGRIVAGAHFLSDAVVSFFVMLVVADVLYHYMLVARPAETALAPAAASALPFTPP
jgi:lipid A 4'-phosphatase